MVDDFTGIGDEKTNTTHLDYQRISLIIATDDQTNKLTWPLCCLVALSLAGKCGVHTHNKRDLDQNASAKSGKFICMKNVRENNAILGKSGKYQWNRISIASLIIGCPIFKIISPAAAFVF